MSTSCLKGHRAGHPDAVDSSFDTLFLAGLRQFIQQFEGIFPDRRLHRVFGQLLKGVIAAGVPILSRIAAAVIGSTDPRRGFHVAKRYYRWLENDRFSHRDLLKPAYGQTRRLFSSVKDRYILVALDFSNLEKPYGYRFENLCTLKATGRRTGPRLRKGLVPGYNQLAALAIAKDRVGLTYARTISYQEADFLSLNREIFRAIRYSKTILRGHKLRFVCDSQFDDEKTFHYIVRLDEEFIIRLRHNRTLLVPFSRKKREVLLEEFVPLVRCPIRFEAWFRVGGRWRKCQVTLGYRKVWLPGHQKPYWLVISHVYGLFQTWILLTNVPVLNQHIARQIWHDYRHRWEIEGEWRFLKEEGLRIEDFKVLSLEGIRRMVSIVLLAALLILNGRHFFPDKAWQILLRLGGKLGLRSERDGPYLLLRGLCKVLTCLATLALLKQEGLLQGLLELLDSL